MSKERIAKQCICCGGADLKKSPAVLMPFVAKRVFDHKPVMISPEWGMRDLRPGMAYSLCNSVQCASCGVLFLDFRFSDAEMTSLYNNYRDEDYIGLREHYEPGYRERNKKLFSSRHAYIADVENFLEPFVPLTPSLLDWGGDTGINTPLKKQARLVHIYDISNKPVIAGAQRVDLETAKKTKYDLIVCIQVLEHIPYPKDIISEIVSIMDSNTLLYLEVPYEELMRAQPSSKDLYVAKHYWHEHINFFSEESLMALIERSGLRLLEMKSTRITHNQGEPGCINSVVCCLA